MTESQWTKKLGDYWQNFGVLVLPYVGTEFAMNWPDRFVTCVATNRKIAHPSSVLYKKGFSGWIEFKNPKTILRDAQWVNIRRLQQFGTMACVVRRVSLGTKGDFGNEKLKVYITDKRHCDAETIIDDLLPTLTRMFGEIRDTTHNYSARPGFFVNKG